MRMNDLKFTTAGDYMADYDRMLGTTDTNFVSSDIEENAPSGNYLTKVRDKEQIYDIQVEKDVAEIINLIMLREYTVMRYELGIR